ncbi:MAG: ABC transporter permease [Clostridia bacterium]|nr:ABC transporter permease [Clostridia bacterium]
MRRLLRYFAARLKGHIKASPAVLLAVTVIVASLAAVGSIVIKNVTENDESAKIFNVGITGDMSQRYVELVIDTMKKMDDSRFALDFIVMDEEEAIRELRNGSILGYLRIPPGFVDAASRAEFISTYYVAEGTGGALADSLVADFMKVAETFANETQKGVFGLERYLYDEGMKFEYVDRVTDDLTMRYVEYILKRNEMQNVILLGETDVPVGGYYFSAFSLFFIMLMPIACAPFLVKRDMSMPRLLYSKRTGPVKQVLAEYLAYAVFAFVLSAMVVTAFGAALSSGDLGSAFGGKGLGDFALFASKLLPCAAMLFAMQTFLFECVSGVVGGVLLQFVAAISLSYVSGYFYPSSFFPQTVQKIAQFLPGGVAFSFAKRVFAGSGESAYLPYIALYTVAFLALTALVRRLRIGGDTA